MSALAKRFAPGGERSWLLGFAVCALLLLVVAPALLSDFRLGLLAKYLCFAMIALGIAVAWGNGGMLVLGQGLFFGLGGYAMAMYLKLDEAGATGGLPDFMTWSGVEELPLIWEPFKHAWFAVLAVVVVPVVVAGLLGLLVFRSRVRGPYFAILTQALAAAFVILLVGQQASTGGTNGLTNIQTFFGLTLADPADQRTLYLLVAIVLGALYLLARQLLASRYGRLLVAVRDSEDRARFLGYSPTRVKVLAFCTSAAMAGIAGALFVPVVGIISPALLGIVPSIEMVLWAAVGGRMSLAGAIAGALLVNLGKTELSERFPSQWTYALGALFVLVVMVAPNGIAGLVGQARTALAARLPRRGPVPALAVGEPTLKEERA
ncbi:urea ABC transporter permease subunit UrtC [Conexibacter sp. SYSU D00693]|uniref:urea ABC transporter permease subunit UrtC n=1 Tax=Conexibacter sp. SYSU D00693 TaxID=2812560 RepID=UPI00196B26C5|nr:urea ABC transporter permease subunit UrtC [Conexibacter sp. SYSU D00693]